MLATMLRDAGHNVNVLDAELLNLSPEETANAAARMNPDRVIATINPLVLRQSTAWSKLWEGEVSFLLNEPFAQWVQERLPGRKVITGDWFSKVLGKNVLPKDYPVADFSFVQTARYTRQQLMITEGCNHSCHFCHFSKTVGREWSTRPISVVIEELRRLRAIGRRFISIFDNELALKRDYCLELMAAIREAKLDILWETNTRVSTLDDKLLEAMARAGCVNSGYGVECAVQSVLDANNKEITVEQIVEVARLFRKHGIHTRTYILVGIHAQTEEHIRKTADFLLNTLRQRDTAFELVFPMPGTPLEKSLIDQCRMNKKMTPANMTWIARHINGDLSLEGEEMEKPGWDYDQITFDEATSLVRELRGKIQGTTAKQKAWALARRHGGLSLLLSSIFANPRKIVRKLWV
jgi:pyruvate-formate lyase-activating enzyme